MSEPRIIPAQEAADWVAHLEAANMTGNPEYRHWTTIVALHEKVDEQEELLTGMGARRLTQDKKIRAQAAQIQRLQEALRAWLPALDERYDSERSLLHDMIWDGTLHEGDLS